MISVLGGFVLAPLRWFGALLREASASRHQYFTHINQRQCTEIGFWAIANATNRLSFVESSVSKAVPTLFGGDTATEYLYPSTLYLADDQSLPITSSCKSENKPITLVLQLSMFFPEITKRVEFRFVCHGVSQTNLIQYSHPNKVPLGRTTHATSGGVQASLLLVLSL